MEIENRNANADADANDVLFQAQEDVGSSRCGALPLPVFVNVPLDQVEEYQQALPLDNQPRGRDRNRPTADEIVNRRQTLRARRSIRYTK